MVEITLKQLHEDIAQKIKDGHGDKVILLSNDDEGNGVHQMFYTLDDRAEVIEGYGYDPDKYIIVG